MDNGTHTLCGLVLARAGGERLGPLATPTLVIASNLPDGDVVGALWGGRPWYLCHHRGLTHALIGLAVEAVLLGLVMTWLGRRLPERPRARNLVAAAAIGLLSHLALDGLNTYGVRPWLPFDPTWYYGDTAFIVDPWLWLILGAAACLGAPTPRPPAPASNASLDAAERAAAAGANDAARDLALAALPRAGEDQEVLREASRLGWRLSTAAWWLMAGAVILLLVGNDRGVPPAVALLWGPLMIAAIVARGRGVTGRRRHVAAAAVALLALPYLATMRALNAAAFERAREWAHAQGLPPVEGGVVHPTPVIPWRFHALVVTGGTIHDVDLDLRTGEARRRTSLERNLDDPLLRHPAVTGTPEHAAWRTFARLPFTARAELALDPRAPDARTPVLILGDARYAPRPEPAWCNLVVPLPTGDTAR